MDTTLHDPLVGHVLDGRYRVDARVAAGGMATVYQALDTRLDRVLALKVMHPSLATDAAFVERFIREAKSVARLAHPNVVGVFDQGADGGHVYLAMEYVAGCTLRDVLRERGALQPRAALDILEPVLAALGAAHRAGFVHRDMKPENVLIGDDGRVKVADFGLARAVDANTSASTGTLLGTVSYLAPEQIEMGTADVRADVYACGVVLYEMLTGSKPHTGTTPAQVLYQALNEDVPPPSAVAPGVAPELDGVVAMAAARNIDARPADAVALLGMVRTVRAGLSEAQLDAVPPTAKDAPEGAAEGATERTTVLSRRGPAVPPTAMPTVPPPPAADPLNRTSVIDFSAEPPPGPPPGGAPGSGRRSRMPRRPVIAIVAAVLLALGIGAGVWYINDGQFTRVPGVIDTTQAQATKKLKDAGLDVEVKQEFNEAAAKGKVFKTDPGAGKRIRKTGTVTITVSQGPERVEVPNVAGMPLATAKQKIRDEGLSVGEVTRRFSGETPRGSVLSTDPRPGTRQRPDAPVAVVVSKGEPVDVPDVVGDSLDDARSDLEDEGFKVKIADQQVFSDEDKGSVARQSPEGDSEGAEGDVITLTVSKGQQMIEVPDVTGLSEDDAKQQLTDAGFEVKVDKPLLFPEDNVDSQSVDGGDEAPKGSTITIKLEGGF